MCESLDLFSSLTLWLLKLPGNRHLSTPTRPRESTHLELRTHAMDSPTSEPEDVENVVAKTTNPLLCEWCQPWDHLNTGSDDLLHRELYEPSPGRGLGDITRNSWCLICQYQGLDSLEHRQFEQIYVRNQGPYFLDRVESVTITLEAYTQTTC